MPRLQHIYIKSIIGLLCFGMSFIMSIQTAYAQCGTPVFTDSTINIPSNNRYGTIVTGDFNHDNNLDMVVNAGGTVFIPGNGMGGFGTPVDIGSANVGELYTADFNNDTHLDLLYATSTAISIQLGNGMGGFGPRVSYFPGAPGALTVAIGDLNNDGKLDLAVTANGIQTGPSSHTPGNVTIWHGTGTGTFTLSQTLLNGARPTNPVLGDFNSDGKLDLVVGMDVHNANPPPAPANIRFGDGSGGLSAPVNLPQIPQSKVAAQDVNADGKVDLIAFGESELYVSLSNGNGTFSAPLSSSFPFAYAKHAFGDYNSDGKIDVAVGTYQTFGQSWTAKLSILLGDGAGNFSAPIINALSDYPNSIANADFNEDGKLDIAVWITGLNNGSDLRLLINSCVAHTRNRPFDFDGDGRTDLSVFRPSEGLWRIFNSLEGNERLQFWGLGADIITPADYDGDTKTDLAVFRPGDGNWYLLESLTNTMRVVHWGASSDIPTPADYDNDGKADVAVWRPTNGYWYILKSTDNNLLAQQWGSGSFNDQPVMGDYDGDGKADFAVMRPGSGGSSNLWYVLRSSDNSFITQAWGVASDTAVQGDYDGDAKTDLAVFRPSNNFWYILQSQNNTPRYVQSSSGSNFPVPGDYEGDGKLDVAVFTRSAGTEILWTYYRSSNNTPATISFGDAASDDPVPAAFIP